LVLCGKDLFSLLCMYLEAIRTAFFNAERHEVSAPATVPL